MYVGGTEQYRQGLHTHRKPIRETTVEGILRDILLQACRLIEHRVHSWQVMIVVVVVVVVVVVEGEGKRS